MDVPRSIVDEFLVRVPLPVTDAGACPYLPGRLARTVGFALDDELDGPVYAAFMDRGFRRSGRVFYRPECGVCHLCIPIRVPAATFVPSRSQRRVWKRNADVRVEATTPIATDEKYGIFKRYIAAQHDGTMSADRGAFERFLFDPCVPAMEVDYFVGRRLAGVSLIDDAPPALSSVYMFYDPQDAGRSLGTFSILWEIAHCRALGRPYYYLGYWVPGSAKMAYKADFRPAEFLDLAGRWVPMSAAGLG